LGTLRAKIGGRGPRQVSRARPDIIAFMFLIDLTGTEIRSHYYQKKRAYERNPGPINPQAL